ncbi:platelet factor 4-like [Crocuta crocuta]
MKLGAGAGSRAPSPWASLRLLLLGLLLLPAVVALPRVDAEDKEHLRCVCVKTISGVHPKHINSLEVLGAAPHCSIPQIIATLKHGRKVCLDPNAPLYKKIIRKLLKS